MLKQYIDGLECVRVNKGDISIQNALEKFNCGDPSDPRNSVAYNMVDRFKGYISGELPFVHDRYYIIKEKGNDEIMLFFSLQTSQIYLTQTISPEDLSELKYAYNAANCDDYGYGSVPDPDILKAQMEMFENLKRYNDKNATEFTNFMQLLIKVIECKTLDKQNNIYVDRIIPSVEVVNFCKNLNADTKWRKSGFMPAMGATLFWYMILPIIEQVSDLIGCTYVSLFAADVDSDDQEQRGKLLAYYQNALSFENRQDLGILKPSYDWKCVFLCQEIQVLSSKKENFEALYLSGVSEDDV